MHAAQSTQDTSTASLDLVLLYPGAIEGGSDQIIIDVLPQVVSRPQVAAWAFERTLDPVPVVALLLDVQADALSDIVDSCEDLLSSQVRDEPALAMQPLVETPGRGRGQSDVPLGVRHSRIDSAGGAQNLRAKISLEQAISTVAMSVLSNVRRRRWDRKTIAPSLLTGLLDRLGQREESASAAYAVMQQILAADPNAEALTRQFRMNAHKLGKLQVPVLLEGAPLEEFEAETGAVLDALAAAVRAPTHAGEAVQRAMVWQRLAAGIGFAAVEAAYIACLASSVERGRA
jgi:hypothetical protein